MAFRSFPPVVLVVDDEVFARLFAVQIFLDQGYTVLEAVDAEECLAVLDRNDDVELLFTDIGMPGAMDGLALMDRVRDLHPAIALVATSGQAPPADGTMIEGSWFLAKPYTAHALMNLVREILAERRDPTLPRAVA